MSQNIGYIIAVPVIELFLGQFETTGSFPGCASLEVPVQSLESPALCGQLMIPGDIKGGIRVRPVSPRSASLASTNGYGFTHLRISSLFLICFFSFGHSCHP